MSKLAFVAVIYALIGVGAAHAQWDTRTNCYTWNGGNFSSGGFAQCDTNIAIVQEKPAPKIAPAPIMMPIAPMQSCPPPPKATRHIVKKKPKVQC